MSTHHTGIPLSRRNIQPPLNPVTKITVNKVVLINGVLDPTNTGLYYIHIKNDSTGVVVANWVSISAVQPFVLSSIPYGTYTVSEIWMFALRTDNVTPSTFTISASNPQQVVEIENEITTTTFDYIIEEDNDYINSELNERFILEDAIS